MNPIKMRTRVREFEAMQYDGTNDNEIMAWVWKTDPLAKKTTSFHTPIAVSGDGSTHIRVVRYLDIHSLTYSLRLWVGSWIFKDAFDRLIAYNDEAVNANFVRIPEEE